MTLDPLALTVDLDRASGRMLDTAKRLTDGDLAGPSLLPGWTRGHVLTHLARNADALVNLLTWARTGVVTPPYPSREHRTADIEAGAGRPVADQVADVEAAVRGFAEAADAVPAEAWTVVLEATAPQPAAMVVWMRLREVEVHHVDLDAGYGPADWPDAFSHRVLHEVVSSFVSRGDVWPLVIHATDIGHDLVIGSAGGGPTVSGPAYALAGWLTGRTSGTSLDVSPAGPLPQPPDWM